MHSICLAQGLLSLVSDASVQKNKQSGFAWVITNKNTTMWRGVGLAPGHAEDMYSGWAEAFGLLAGLLFIQSYLSYYSWSHNKGARLQCFCDNQGIISNINSMLDTTMTQPNNATNDDYDVYRAICNTVKLCDLIKIKFWHVKGHQDQNPKCLLTHIEQLNVECDTQAKWYTTTTSCSSTAIGNPSIPEAKPHLCIGKKIICRNVFSNLWWAVSTPKYRKELQKKYHWLLSDFKNIHWDIFQAALKPFKPDDHQHIILFINKKLPLCASKAHPHYGSPLCPLCQREQESAQHFLTCRHPDWNKLFTTLKTAITNTTQKYQLHPCIFTSLWLGLESVHTNTPCPDIIGDLEPPLKHPIRSQTRLGWTQLYQGRMSKNWVQAIDQIHPKLPIAGEQIMTILLKVIWSPTFSTSGHWGTPICTRQQPNSTFLTTAKR